MTPPKSGGCSFGTRPVPSLPVLLLVAVLGLEARRRRRVSSR